MLTSNSQQKKYKLNGVSNDKSISIFTTYLHLGFQRFAME